MIDLSASRYYLLRILFVHNRYLDSGGEDRAFENEVRLLIRGGHSIELFEEDNRRITNCREKVQTAWNAVNSKRSREAVAGKIRSFAPDVVHVHNFFPLLTPSIYDACLREGVAVVQTLHNYRILCPGAFLMRDGRICETCITHSPYRSVWHSCYRHSIPGTFFAARMVSKHRKAGTWKSKVDRFITLSNFCRDKFIQGGVPQLKISVKSNFVPDPFPRPERLKRSGKGLYVGRMSAEKGVWILMNGLKLVGQTQVDLIGNGPLLSALRKLSVNNARFLGRLGSDDISRKLFDASFLVLPSEWYECFPMVVAEAFAHGCPVIASRLGSLAEIVDDGVTGLHFTPGNPMDLADKLVWMQAHPDECERMGRNARETYLKKYTPEENYQALMEIYSSVIQKNV